MSSKDIDDLPYNKGISRSAEKKQAFDILFTTRDKPKPAHFSLDDTLKFNCHKDIACFNNCCKQTEIQLTPYDIVRLKNHLGSSSKEFVAHYTFPFEMDTAGMPGLHLAHKPSTSECVFLTEKGCSVYENRPTACRYYPLGNLGVRKKESGKVNNVFFIVKEAHCLGHNEANTQTVRQYLYEQGAAHYDQFNEDWRDIIVRKRSGSLSIGKPSDRSVQLFDMCSYDIDSFRDFIQGSGFLNLFDLSETTLSALIENEEKLLLFAMKFLKQVLFGEKTIPLKNVVREKHLMEVKDVLKIQEEADTLIRRAAKPVEEWTES